MTGVTKAAQDVLSQFCEEWNQRGLNPALFPLQCVPYEIAEDVIRLQIGHDVENAIELPSDISNTDAFVAWARSLEDVTGCSKPDNKRSNGQVAAKDRKGRVAVLDVDISMMPVGKFEHKARVEIKTVLANHALRSTLIEPHMLNGYDKAVSGAGASETERFAYDRVELFRKSLLAMLRDLPKEAKKIREKYRLREDENAHLQALVDEIKTYGVPLKALSEDQKLDAGIGLDGHSNRGSIHFKVESIDARITTQSNPSERKAFATLVNSIIDGQGY